MLPPKLSVLLRKFFFLQSPAYTDTYSIHRTEVDARHYVLITNAEVFQLPHRPPFIMSLCFLLIAPLIFRAITDGHPLISTGQLVDSNSLALWDNGDSSSEQLPAGTSGSNFLPDSSDTADNDLFTPAGSSSSNDIENDSESSIFHTDLGLISMDDPIDFALDAGGSVGNFVDNPSCTSQARKRDESDDLLLGNIIISHGP